MNHDDIVASYIREYRPRLEQERRFFMKLPDLIDAIANAVRPHGRKHGHQFRTPDSVLDQAERHLTSIASTLKKTKRFADLHQHIAASLKTVRGIGELAIYNFTQRIGMYLGIEPDLVYLHRGARQGAAVLGLNGATLDPKQLPKSFRQLTPAEIEDVLCIYKNELAGSPLAPQVSGCVSTRSPRRLRC